MNKVEALEKLFNARSVAVIGASGEIGSGKLSEKPLEYILKHGYKGKVFPVNPKYELIGNLKCYSDVTEIADEVDVALILLPAKHVPYALKNCGEKGVKVTIICSSGFGEIGESGNRLQKEIVDIADKYKLLICGPNTDGLVKADTGLTLGFQPILEESLLAGPIGIISQSGSVTSSLIKRFKVNCLGISYSIACGNEAMVGMEDYLLWVINDPKVKVVCLFMETIRRPDAFYKAALLAKQMGKPIITLKVGKSIEGQRAASAHTGALIRGHDIYVAIFEKYGVIEATDFEEMVEEVKLFLNQGVPNSLNTLILSMSGGIGGMVADIANEVGLKLPQFNQEVEERIKKELEFGTPINPLDLTGQVVNEPELLGRFIKYVMEQDEHDIFVLILGLLPGQAGLKMLKDYRNWLEKHSDKIFIVFSPAGNLGSAEDLFVKENNMFVTSAIAKTLIAIKSLYKYKGQKVIEIQQNQKVNKNKSVVKQFRTEYEAKQLMERYGIHIPKSKIVNNLEEAKNAALEIGLPVVLKVNSTEIIHKSDLGGVLTNLRNLEEVKNAYNSVAKRLSSSVLIEEMVDFEQEIILGIRKQEPFGQMLLVGLGGIFVELLKDYKTALVPVNENEIVKMFNSLKGSRLLSGYRGGNAVNLTRLAQVVINFQKLCQDMGDELKEAEINPLVVCRGGETFKALDAVISMDS